MDRMDKYWIESMLGKPEQLASLYEHEAYSRLCNALDIADHPAPDVAGKQWVIDQMVRVLLGEDYNPERYAAWRKFQESHGGWSDGTQGGESTGSPMRLLPAGTMNIIPPMPSQFMRLPDPGESAKQRIGYRVTICHTVYEACDEEWPSGKLLFIREDLVAEWKRTNLPSPNDLPKPDVIVGGG